MAKVITVNTPGPQGPVGPSPDITIFATTGSNTFVGNQTITGSIFFNGGSKVTNQYYANSIDVQAGTNGWAELLSNNGDNAIWVDNSGSYITTNGYYRWTFDYTGSLTLPGPVLGNVTALTITSNTASLNLSLGSFYTLQLVSGSNIYINPSNIRPGETVSLLISTTGSATVTFPNTVLQPSGSSYTPTTSSAKDILTFISFDNTNLYVASVKNLI